MSSLSNTDAALATTVAFLQRPESYPHRPGKVEVIETHFACLFFAGPFVYKLKKPIRFHGIDFTTLVLRRANCELELVLNRRLAEAVYIDVVPVRMEPSGPVLESAGAGAVIEWLVKMHCLPRDRMLDARAQAGQIPRGELQRLLEKLTAFYARAPRASWNSDAYRQHLEQHILATSAELLAHNALPDRGLVEQVAGAQLAFVNDSGRMLGDRCSQRRIVDAHGDLRPEHILLGDDPQIIDCLEFSAQLRLLDSAEEIAFLALECTVLGRSDLAREIVALYREIGRDDVPQPLFDFYYSRRALVRALLSLWHLDELLADPLRAHWLGRARWYLEAGRAALVGTASAMGGASAVGGASAPIPKSRG
jgi:aminoglycoside phosphotransferase family enzyme